MPTGVATEWAPDGDPERQTNAGMLESGVGDGLELERKAEVDVAPADVAAGVRDPSAREQTLSVLLRKRFNKLLPQKVTIDKIELGGKQNKIRLEPIQNDSDNGWLTLGFARSSKK